MPSNPTLASTPQASHFRGRSPCKLLLGRQTISQRRTERTLCSNKSSQGGMQCSLTLDLRRNRSPQHNRCMPRRPARTGPPDNPHNPTRGFRPPGSLCLEGSSSTARRPRHTSQPNTSRSRKLRSKTPTSRCPGRNRRKARRRCRTCPRCSHCNPEINSSLPVRPFPPGSLNRQLRPDRIFQLGSLGNLKLESTPRRKICQARSRCTP